MVLCANLRIFHGYAGAIRVFAMLHTTNDIEVEVRGCTARTDLRLLI